MMGSTWQKPIQPVALISMSLLCSEAQFLTASSTLPALDASPQPMAFAEVYGALQTGVVDGEENPISSIALGKLQEVQKYLTMDGHVWSENVMVMNSAKFNSLPVGVQQILLMGALR